MLEDDHFILKFYKKFMLTYIILYSSLQFP